jgi:DNA repair protein RadC
MALEMGATGLILCHNHPSGTLVPSDADKQITKKLRTFRNKKVLDHLIVTEFSYFSFVDEGIFLK